MRFALLCREANPLFGWVRILFFRVYLRAHEVLVLPSGGACPYVSSFLTPLIASPSFLPLMLPQLH